MMGYKHDKIRAIIYILITIALTIIALCACVGCSPKHIINTDYMQVDSTRMKQLIKENNELKQTNERIITLYENIKEDIKKIEETNTQEIVTIIKYDTIGRRIEEITKDRNILSKKEFNKQKEQYTDVINRQKDSITLLSNKIDSLNISNDTLIKQTDKSVLIKTKTPKWCWFLLIINVLAIMVFIFRLIKKI